MCLLLITWSLITFTWSLITCSPYTLLVPLRSLGMEIADAELEDMVAEFDLDKDGMINQDEFMAIMAATQD